MKIENDIGKIIKNSRKAIGYTQEQLAERADIDAKNLSKIENGQHVPTYNTLMKLYNILNFDIENSIFCKDSKITSKNPIFAKSIAILKSSQDDIELENYYKALKLVQKIMNDRTK